MKKKLFLSSAIFATAVALSSCGGGGGSSSSTTPPPPPPPSATQVGTVLVTAQKGFTSPGALVGLFEGKVMSDGTVQWGSDLNSGDNYFEYYHEFSNNNVLLYDVNTNDPYLYSSGSLTPITSGKDYLGNNVSAAGTALSAFGNIFLPNFVIMDNGSNIEGIYTQNGKYIEAPGTREHLIYAGTNYIVFGDGGANERVFVLKKDGTLTELDWDDLTAKTQSINNGRASVLDRVEGTDTILLGHNSANQNAIFVIGDDGSVQRITNSGNTSTGDDPMANISSGKIVKSGNNYYVAVQDNTPNIEYFKVLGPVNASSVVYTPSAPITGNDAATTGNYSLDGQGHLYAINNCDKVPGEYELFVGYIDSNGIFNNDCKNTAANDDLTGYNILSFSQGILMSDSLNKNFLHYLYGSSQPTNVALNPNVISAVSYCNSVNNTTSLTSETDPVYTNTKTETIVGEATDNLMCAYSGNPDEFAWVEYKGTGLYDGNYTADVNGDTTGGSGGIAHLTATQNSMIFVDFTLPNLTRTFECTKSGCTARNLTKEFFFDVYNGQWFVRSNDKIKSDTNVLSDGVGYNYLGRYRGAAPNINAAYFTSTISAPYTVNIASGAVDTTTLNIPFTTAGQGARGGNISLGLNKAAHVYKPISAQCPAGFYDNVWYKDATNNFQTLNRPTGTCLINVLQVK